VSTAAALHVRTPGTPAGSYDVVVEPRSLASLAERLAEHCPAHRYALITDSHVEPLYGRATAEALRAAGLEAELLTFAAGEANKTRETWAELSDQMLAAGFGRDAAVVALGGGVVGDVAGFVAATYMRGVPVVQVPTTLLAMVDASVGGKTGVDTPAGKNLVGAFHPPRLVVIDPEVLGTLPAAELRAGLAEAVKHGAIADAAHLDWIEAHAERLLAADVEVLAELIDHSVRIKADFVARDERESGPRKMLNFGHTIGHAVEAATGYGVLHGEAIAIGMLAEARLGERLGITEPGTADRLKSLLGRLGLPTELPAGVAAEDVVGWTRSDKKARAGHVEYALIRRLGEAAVTPHGGWSWSVEDQAVRRVLD
jgi:3-dehydroquinate synthase